VGAFAPSPPAVSSPVLATWTMAHAEDASRFSTLLQPIRDLSKVWKIDIADELQRYVEELASKIGENR